VNPVGTKSKKFKLRIKDDNEGLEEIIKVVGIIICELGLGEKGISSIEV
jgi:hypothetical protein